MVGLSSVNCSLLILIGILISLTFIVSKSFVILINTIGCEVSLVLQRAACQKASQNTLENIHGRVQF